MNIPTNTFGNAIQSKERKTKLPLEKIEIFMVSIIILSSFFSSSSFCHAKKFNEIFYVTVLNIMTNWMKEMWW